MAPENYRVVTYESIVKYPEQFVETMESFIGMKRTHSSDRSRIHKSQVHVIGNRMRETADRGFGLFEYLAREDARGCGRNGR